jgi:hypothetical protein
VDSIDIARNLKHNDDRQLLAGQSLLCSTLRFPDRRHSRQERMNFSKAAGAQCPSATLTGQSMFSIADIRVLTQVVRAREAGSTYW